MSTPNILMMLSDEECHWSFVDRMVPDKHKQQFWDQLPARRWLRDHGVSFDRHYTTTAPCSPSRAVLFTGHHAPDLGIIDNMDFGFQHSLGAYATEKADDAGPPTLAHLLGNMGYYVAYQGKVHLAKDSVLAVSDDTNPMETRYGFKDWKGTLPVGSPQDLEGPLCGHLLDPAIAKHAVQWLEEKAPSDIPWFLSVNFINPHDIMLVDIDGKGIVQRPSNTPLSPIPKVQPYFQWWDPITPPNYDPDGSKTVGPALSIMEEWASVVGVTFGNIPFDAPCRHYTSRDASFQTTMTLAYINYYLNCIIDLDRHLWSVIQAALEKQDRPLLIIFSADHGELAMSHSGLNRFGGPDGMTPILMPQRQKGPFLFEENCRIPMLVASPNLELVPQPGTSVQALTAHLDLVPTLMDWVGYARERYETDYGDYLSKLPYPLKAQLPGTSFKNLVNQPSLGATPQWQDDQGNGRDALLFTMDNINCIDADYAREVSLLKTGESVNTMGIDWSRPAMMRGFFDGTLKFCRYFSPLAYSFQAEQNGDYANLTQPYGTEDSIYNQELQLFVYSTEEDWHENRNLADDPSVDIASLNSRLLELMNRELNRPKETPLPVLRQRYPHTQAYSLVTSLLGSMSEQNAELSPELAGIKAIIKC